MAPPSLRHVAVVAGVATLGVGGFMGLRATSAFSVERVQVHGGDASLRRAIEAEARAEVGDRSLLDVDADAVAARLRRLPGVRSVRVDRSFPHSLAVDVVPEVPVARLPFGERDAIVARSGRVLEYVDRGRRRSLPALAAAPVDVPAPGGRVQAPFVRDEIDAAAAFQGQETPRVTSLRWTRDGLVARVAEGWQLRLGDAADTTQKLDTARLVVRALAKGTRAELRYVDVSAPTVPVVRTETGDPLTLAATGEVAVPPPTDEAAAGTESDAEPTGSVDPSLEVPADASDVLIDLFGYGERSS